MWSVLALGKHRVFGFSLKTQTNGIWYLAIASPPPKKGIVIFGSSEEPQINTDHPFFITNMGAKKYIKGSFGVYWIQNPVD